MTSPDPTHLSPRLQWALFALLVLIRWAWFRELGPSDGELMAWAAQDFAGPFPAPLGVVTVLTPFVTLLGDHSSTLRMGFAILAAAPVLLVGPRKVSIALAASLPILTVPGALATPAAPVAALWLGAWQLAPSRPGWSGLLTGLGAALHPAGLLVALPALLRTSSRSVLALTAALSAAPFLPESIWSTTSPLTGELSPIGLVLAATILGGPLLLVALGARIRSTGAPRLAALSALIALVLMVATSTPAPLLAGPLALGILAVAPAKGRPHRIAWHAVGIAAVLSVTLAAALRFPLAPLPTDLRSRFVDTASLAQTITAWEIDTVYAVSPPDIARLRWHGLKATSPPPVHPLALPDDIILVMPQSADPDLPFHMGWDHDRDGPHPVVVYLTTPDPTHERPAAAWNLTVWRRPLERRNAP